MLSNKNKPKGCDELYCVVQERERKTFSKGKSKGLVVNACKINNQEFYSYTRSEERFQRPIKTAYKVTLHSSYRENKKVKKRQYSICTIGYYDFVDYGYYDFVEDRLNELSQELNMTGEEIYSLVCCKLNPLEEKINQEYKDTEEYKCSMEVEEILQRYRQAKAEFENKYGVGNFDYCYDVFLNLRNAENLKKIKQIYEEQDYFTGSYQRKNHSNYKYNSNKSSYQEKHGSNYEYSSRENSHYGEDDKKILKKIYKTLARNFHPDKNDNSDESVRAMQIINDLKELWQL